MQPKTPMAVPIPDRMAAGRALAGLLEDYRGSDAIVLALPRGGVPVAWEIARALDLPLDLLPVRKLGMPGHAEYALGAIAGGGVRVLNPQALHGAAPDPEYLEQVTARERRELERREQLYRGERPPPSLRGRTVLLVDDGLATGATMRAAVQAVRRQAPARIVLAVPVASREALAELRARVEEIVCPLVPDWLSSIGEWYLDFAQTEDARVLAILAEAWARPL
ncbi:phosphoribosyltransferase [Geopseudomonas guangdongensis]|uniref:Predicted phosphoribosyltransferase n=1 Tax=Geopseudomonas guangdongensis TaxID=1245526 RepID=A0A1H2GYZ1_9GAMM|nr:phosphoribosyltransferase family protein [Pseudomonas guangdongensis]SDU24725.1 Predicted phosphoribosyltransferase [Pseudomonas guangdongensis]